MSQQHNGESTVDEKIPATGFTLAIEEQQRVATSELEKAVAAHAVPSGGLPLPSAISATLSTSQIDSKVVQGNLPGVKDEDDHTTPSSTASSRESRVSTAALTPQVSVDGRGNTYPEGGIRAWLVVYGSFSGMTACFGLMNTIGAYQAYLSTHQLSHLNPSTIGWIFSLYTFMSFFCGIQIGPVFDAKGPRGLMIAGTVCLVGGVLGFAESTSMSPTTENTHISIFLISLLTPFPC